MLRSIKNNKFCINTICRTFGNTKNLFHRSLATNSLALKKKLEPIIEPGAISNGFLCEKMEYISDFNMTAYQLRHEKLQSKYLHLQREDQNNTFSINFRTTPFDSTGIPHILEHIVLCGSKKFPIRDPFFKMLNRSMSTFMNAMTGPDYTMYPFSSMNETDFRNLQSVYLDAVFNANLNYLDFLQEGWRLENKDLTNINSDYVINGVVYNEMKGAFSDNSNLFGEKFLNEILPDHTYGNCSGGDPICIPNLTHAELVAFHRKYYHPSNARFFSYGNFPLETSLQYINDYYLSNYDKIETKFSLIPAQKRWTQPKSQHIVSRFDNMGAPIETQNQIAIGFLLTDIADIYETFLVNVLTELMVKGPNSPFYQNLIEPNISGGYSQLTGFESSIKDTMFTVGLRDVNKKDFKLVEKIVNETIEQICDKGFEENHVTSVLNNIELGLKHQSPRFGLGLLFNITPIWNHEGNVITAIQYGELINRLRENLKNPKYLQEKVEQYFKNCSHKLVMTMSPDTEYEQRFAASESSLINSMSTKLTNEQKETVFKNANDLLISQRTEQDLNVLPCLSLNDVKTPPENKYQLERKLVEKIPTNICTTDTNSVCYLNGIFNANQLTDSQKSLLPLLAHVIDQLGTHKRDYRDFNKYTMANTSGIHFDLYFSENISNLTNYDVGLSFGTYCLDKNTPEMFEILTELFKEFNFTNVERFNMLLTNFASSLNVGIANSGHVYAMSSAAGLVNESGRLKTHLNGIEHIEFLRNLIETTKPEEILKQLKEIATILFNESSVKYALHATDTVQQKFLQNYQNYIKKTVNSDTQTKPITNLISKELKSSSVHSIMTIPVNYCAKAIQTVPFQHIDFPALRILAKMLSAKYLLPTIREKEGAYGAGVRFGKDGLFNFFSYRDPNSQKTFDTFDRSEMWLRENWSKVNDQVLFESKLGVLQQLDAPIGPGEKGLNLFNYGISQELLIEHREQLLNVNRDDLERVAEKYLKNESATGVGRFILGPTNDGLQQSNMKWTVKNAVP